MKKHNLSSGKNKQINDQHSQSKNIFLATKEVKTTKVSIPNKGSLKKCRLFTKFHN